MDNKEFEKLWRVTVADYGGGSKPIPLKASYNKQYEEAKRSRKAEKRLEKEIEFANCDVKDYGKWIEKLEAEKAELKELESSLLGTIRGWKEKCEGLESKIEKLKFEAGPTNCPHCGSHLKPGEDHKCKASSLWKG